METVPITRQGYEKLKKELEKLIITDRPSVVRAIEEAALTATCLKTR
jgi:transcription elongation factor GreA